MDKLVVNYLIASRVVLIGVSLFGIFQISELVKPHLENSVQYYGVFIILAVVTFSSIINFKDIGKGK